MLDTFSSSLLGDGSGKAVQSHLAQRLHQGNPAGEQKKPSTALSPGLHATVGCRAQDQVAPDLGSRQEGWPQIETRRKCCASTEPKPLLIPRRRLRGSREKELGGRETENDLMQFRV